MIGLSVFIFWCAGKDHDSITFIIACVFSAGWLFCGYIKAQDLCRGQCAVLRIDGGLLLWEVTSKRGQEAPSRGSISLLKIQKLELVFHRVIGEGKTYRNFHGAHVFLVDTHGKHFEIPQALMPGVHHEKILMAIQEVTPAVTLDEKFSDY